MWLFAQGILLRMLEGDTELRDVTHIIIDEVRRAEHEGNFIFFDRLTASPAGPRTEHRLRLPAHNPPLIAQTPEGSACPAHERHSRRREDCRIHGRVSSHQRPRTDISRFALLSGGRSRNEQLQAGSRLRLAICAASSA